MTPFERLTNDVFRNPDMLEFATVGDRNHVPVIPSEITTDPAVAEFGYNEGASFFLRIRRAEIGTIQRNTLVIFKGTRYIVDHSDLDSSGLQYKVYLKSETSR